jgi:hypothetical protein
MHRPEAEALRRVLFEATDPSASGKTGLVFGPDSSGPALSSARPTEA